jgi:hypothetical protein
MRLAFLMGLKSSVNPFLLATTLVFIIILTTFKHSRAQLIAAGLSYVASVWMINFFVLSGGYDQLIYVPAIEPMIKIVYSFLAICFVYIAAVHLTDWWCYQKGKEPSMFWLRSARELDHAVSTRKLGRAIALVLFSVVVAWFLTFCEARLTQNYYLFVMFQRKMEHTNGGVLSSLGIYAAYMIAYTLPLLLFWVYCIIDASSMRVKTRLNRFISLEKVFLAALYLGVGLGLFYYLTMIIRF